MGWQDAPLAGQETTAPQTQPLQPTQGAWQQAPVLEPSYVPPRTPDVYGQQENIFIEQTGETVKAPYGASQIIGEVTQDDSFDDYSSTLEELGATVEAQAAYLTLFANAYGLIDDASAAGFYAQRRAALANAKKRQPEYMQKFEKDFQDAEGFWGAAAAIASNPRALGRTVVTSAGNSAMPLFGSLAGALAGGPVGFAGGTFVGSTLMEAGAELDQLMAETGIDLTNSEQVLTALSNDSFMDEIRATATRKGVSQGAVETLFAFAGGKFLKGLKPDASKVRKAGAATGDVAVETVGEGAGEGVGQFAAYGEVNSKEVAIEMVAGLAQSSGTVAIQSQLRGKAPEKIIDTEKMQKLTPEQAEGIMAEPQPEVVIEDEAVPVAAPTTQEQAVGQIITGRSPDLSAFDEAQQEIIQRESERLAPLREKIQKGRIKKLDEEISSIDQRIDAEMSVIEERETQAEMERQDIRRQIDEAQEEKAQRIADKKPIKAVDNKIQSLQQKLDNTQAKTAPQERRIDRLLEKRNTLDEELGGLLTVEDIVAETADTRTKPISTRATELERLDVKVTRESQRALRKGFQAAKKDIKATQSQVIDLIKESGLSRDQQSKFINSIKNIQTQEQFNRQGPRLQSRLETALRKERIKQVKNAVKKKLKATKPKMQSGKPVGKLSPEVESLVAPLRKITRLTQQDAAAKLESNIEKLSLVPDAETVLENELLALYSGSDAVSIEKAEDILLGLNELLETGKAGAKLAALKKKERIQDMQARVEAAVGDVDVTVDPDKAWEKFKSGVKNTGKFILNQNLVFRGKLRYVFTTSDKKVSDTLLDDLSLHDEARSLEKSKRENAEKINQLMLDYTGFSDIKTLDKYMMAGENEVVINQVYTMSDGSQERVRMTRSEARKRYMEMQDEAVAESVYSEKGNKWTQQIYDDMVSQLNTEDFGIIKGQFEFYSEYYDKINKAYTEMYGITLPKVERYTPLRRKNIDSNDESEFLKAIMYRGGVAPGSLKSRQPSIKPLEQLSDRQAFYNHVSEMDYFIAYGEKVTFLDRVFNSELMDKIEKKHGKAVAKSIRADIDYFTKRGFNQALSGDNFYKTLIRNFGAAQLASKPQIGLKQITSFPAYADEVSTKDFLAGIVEAVTNPKKALNELKDSSVWTERGIQNLDKDFQDLLNDKSLITAASRNKGLVEFMYFPIKYGDKAAIYLGGYGRYYARRKAGMSKADALRDFEKKTVATQQSADIDQLSEWQRAGSLNRIIVQFMSSPNALARAEIEAMIELSRGRMDGKQFAKTFFIYHILIPNLFALASNGFIPKEEDWEDYLMASALGSVGVGLFVISDLFEMMVSASTTGDWFSPSIRHPGEFLEEFLKGAKEIERDGIGLDDFIDGSKKIDSLLGGTGAILGVPLETWYNQILGVKDLAEGAVDRGTLKLLGYSEWAIDKKILEE